MRLARHTAPDRDGFALVTSLLIILVLSLIAVAAVVLSSTEKRTTFAEGVHATAVFSADAGGEAAIHFLRMSDAPPKIIDSADNKVYVLSNEALEGSQEFDSATHYVRRRPKSGWSIQFVDYDFRIASSGRAAAQGRSDVDLVASRLFREGY
ncbi:MAG: PilX N-terminal domain-containing pilus assembly protein [Candidatus Krumholzibacteriia bacterium]